MQLPEIIAVGLFDSRQCFPGMKSTVPRHVTSYEVEVPMEAGGVSWLDGGAYPVVPGRVLCARPGQERWSVLHYRCRYVKFQTGDPALLALLEAVPGAFRTERSQEYAALLDALREADEAGGPDREVRMGVSLLTLIHLLWADAGRFARQQSLLPKGISDRKLRFILEYIDANYRYPLSLETLAAQINYSPIYFHKLFCAAMGRTPRRYILDRRIRAAREMLALGGIPLAQVAMECGFSSQSYFNFIFKKETGMTPSAYIQANNARYRG